MSSSATITSSPIAATAGRCTLERALAAISLLLLCGACRAPDPPPVVQVLPAVAPPPAADPPTASTRSGGDTYAAMRRVHFRLDPLLALDIAQLTGRMHPTRRGRPVDFDDPHSFVLALADAEVGVDTTSLARLMNRYVFGFPRAPLTSFRFAVRDTLLEVRGMLHEAVSAPFTIRATVGVTAGGLIRIHPVSVKVGAVNVGGVLGALGVTLQELIDAKRARGLRIAGNDLLMHPTEPLPPPAITGTLREVRVARGGLVLHFRDSALATRLKPAPRLPVASSYMYFRGGVLHFGKLFMADADMEVVDSVAGDWFDFYLAQYQWQLVAGHSEIRPDYGLRVVMQSYDRLVARRRAK